MPFKKTPKGYGTWQAMKQRCLNPNAKQFKDYGGRGINVCDRWLHSFDNFIADMGEPPPSMSIERIDNNANYSPENCKWATRNEQQRNQRRTRKVTIEGESYLVAELSDISGLKSDTIVARATRGFSFNEVMEKDTIHHNITKENIAKAVKARIDAAAKTCKNGHPRTTENTHITPQGWHSCKICNRARVMRQRERKKHGT
jgi:hypothetical protein